MLARDFLARLGPGFAPDRARGLDGRGEAPQAFGCGSEILRPKPNSRPGVL